MENQDNLSDSLIKSIEYPDWSTVGDVAEATIDTIIDNEFASNLPFIGSIVRLYKATLSIKERIFIKKVAKFLLELQVIPHEDREKFTQKLRDEKLSQQVGETLILLLDRLNDMNKPQIIGRLFRGYITDKIDYEIFLRLSAAVEKCYLPDLSYLADWYARNRKYNLSNDKVQKVIFPNVNTPKNFQEILANLYLMDVVFKFNDKLLFYTLGVNKLIGTDKNKPWLRIEYNLNKYGYLLAEIALYDWYEKIEE